MPLFESAEALTDFLETIATTAIDNVGEEVVEVVKENVRNVVYDPYSGYKIKYERHGEDGGFLGSWTHTVDFNAAGNVQTLIFSDPASMHLHKETFVHGSPFESLDDFRSFAQTDRRDRMDEYIAKGTGWDFQIPDPFKRYPDDNWWTRPRDYFTPSNKQLWNGKVVEKTAEASMRTNNSGIKIIKKTS